MPFKDVRVRRQRKSRYHDTVVQLKASSCCSDCKGFYPACVMDFDHVRGKKMANIAQMVTSGYSLKTLMAEIAKCELVCANCHRVRTYERQHSPEAPA